MRRAKKEYVQGIRKKKNGAYYESHHIIPKCLGGTGWSNNWNHENIVPLTAREHFICHWLLHEMFPSNKKLLYAFSMMCNVKDKRQFRYVPSSRIVEYCKLKCSENHHSKQQESRKKLSEKRLGKSYEDISDMETVARWKNKKRDYMIKNNPMHNKEIVNRMTGSNNPFYNKKHSAETIEKLKRKRKKSTLKRVYPIIECPYCGKIGRSCNMTRYHFKNCKNKNERNT